MEFRTQYSNDTGDFISNSGDPLVPEYAVSVNKKTGAEEFLPTGEFTNMQDMIDAAYSSVEIHCLMERFQQGDTSALDRLHGFYADVTNMPKNMAEMFQRVNDCQNYFEELPVDVKEVFNNSYTEFFSSMNDNPRLFNERLESIARNFDVGLIDVPEMPSVNSLDEKGVDNESE